MCIRRGGAKHGRVDVGAANSTCSPEDRKRFNMSSQPCQLQNFENKSSSEASRLQNYLENKKPTNKYASEARSTRKLLIKRVVCQQVRERSEQYLKTIKNLFTCPPSPMKRTP